MTVGRLTSDVVLFSIIAFKTFDIFTALHAIQTRSGDKNSVRLSSVRPSVRHTRAL